MQDSMTLGNIRGVIGVDERLGGFVSFQNPYSLYRFVNYLNAILLNEQRGELWQRIILLRLDGLHP